MSSQMMVGSFWGSKFMENIAKEFGDFGTGVGRDKFSLSGALSDNRLCLGRVNNNAGSEAFCVTSSRTYFA